MKTARQSSPQRPPLDVGFLERQPRVGAALTLALLVLLGVLAGAVVGLAATEAVQWVAVSVRSGP